MSIVSKWKEKLKQNQKHLTLPEYMDDRTYKVAEILIKEGLVKTLTITGPKAEIEGKIKELGVSVPGLIIIDPKTDIKTQEYATMFYELRKEKGMTPEQALHIMQSDILFFSAAMLRMGHTDAVVAGAFNTSGDVIRASIQVVGTTPGVKTVSGSFFMESKEHSLLFGDCAVLPNPTAAQLADIATATASTYKSLTGNEPYVALLSFSTKGSAAHEMVTKVQEAVLILKERNVDFHFDGEMQFDAAFVESVGKKKAPGSPVAGRANCFIFPDLNAGNIGYKIAERLGNMQAYGPVMQGLAKPYNDLSRGSSVEDIVNTCVITMLQAK